MAGTGSRLRGLDDAILKPLVSILGRPLISYVLEALVHAGMTTIHMVLGYKGEQLRTAILNLPPPKVELDFVTNPEWQKQNGVSALAVTEFVSGPFLLTMSDHLFDQAVVDLFLDSALPDELNVAIDRKLDSILDLNDAMKIRLHGDRVVAIGKGLDNYNAIDTGLFLCPLEFFRYLEQAKKGDDVSLADGVRAMAQDRKVRGVDIGDAWWQDVDTPEMLLRAEEQMQTLAQFKKVTAAYERVDGV
jgi:1L-myo-inositol 1-phosphate cytidylyltransferase